MTGGALADVRVYLFTYRRNHLLPRALRSLVAQTHTNWVCELHNDDPADPFPNGGLPQGLSGQKKFTLGVVVESHDRFEDLRAS